MNMKRTIVLATAVLLLTACGTAVSSETKKEEAVEILKSSSETDNHSQIEHDNKEDADISKEQTVEKIPATMEMIKKVKVGMNINEVIAIAGTEYVENTIMYEGEAGWSLDEPVEKIVMDYSVGALTEGYLFESPYEDEVDLEGIHQKKRGSLIKIRLDKNGVVEQVMGYYLNESDQKVYEYYQFENGFVKDHSIFPY